MKVPDQTLSPEYRPPPPESELDALGERIAALSAQIQAATYHLLTMIREFDEQGGWNTGFSSCAHWLNWRLGLELGAAREKVRVARALGDLPRLSEAMRRGELSYSKLRALTRVATAENEDDLLGFAKAGTAAHVESLVRAWRRVDRNVVPDGESDGSQPRSHDAELEWENLRHASRYLQAFIDEDGMVVLRARLAPETGATLLRAIEAAAEALYDQSREEKDEDGDGVSAAQRRADAIGLVAESVLAHGLAMSTEDRDSQSSALSGTRAERFQVVVHVDAEVLADPRRPGVSALEASGLGDRQNVSAETSRRLACDSSKVVMRHDSEGRILDVGRKTRTIHPALRRALTHRDENCRFPGCAVKHCEAHHVKHWANGGETNLDNLTLLCRRHHRSVHEEGFTLERLDDGEIRFFRPDGREIPKAPPLPSPGADPEKALAARAVEDGASIDGWTSCPSWDGRALDLGWAIKALWQPRVDRETR